MKKPLDEYLIQRIRRLSSPLEPIPTEAAEEAAPLTGIRAVLFDVYGTLFISGAGEIGVNEPLESDSVFYESIQAAGFNWLVQEAPVRGPERLKHHIRETHARKKAQGIEFPEVDILEEWDKTVYELINENILSGDRSDERLQKLALEYEIRINPVWPMPDLLDCLNALLQSGIVPGIVSNAQFYTPYLFAAFLNGFPEQIGFHKDLCIWSYQTGCGKPSPALFETAAQRLQSQCSIAPREALYVGNDMLNDVWPASLVGFRTALFAGDRRSLRRRSDDPRCSSIQPDRTLKSLTALTISPLKK
ncbi:MAG: HAD family hydrolase [Candidatus Omnitrophica bacterium]|nr:HAD family hydrolase [Candidatus Omnitrophota bacterium]